MSIYTTVEVDKGRYSVEETFFSLLHSLLDCL